MRREIGHYKKRGVAKAWCGEVPMVSFDSWHKVTCPKCRELGALVNELPEPINPIFADPYPEQIPQEVVDMFQGAAWREPTEIEEQ